MHLVIFSTDPCEGYLTKPAILELRSALTRQIFKDDLKNIYVQQNAYRDRLQENALEVMESLIQKMQDGEISNPKLELLITELAERLQNYTGKKVYGYLPPVTKRIVDAIVDELASDERIAEAYSLWQDMRDEVFSFYSKAKPERVPLSQQKEFKPVRNMVIREVVQMMEQLQPQNVERNGNVYAYQSDVLIDALKNALTNNATSVKNALETYVRENGGTAMPETDGYGHSSVSDLPLGLYLFVETRVPEMVTETTAPFLVSLPMTSTADNASWLYDVTLYPKNLTGIPTLEKTVREAKTSSGKNNGSADIADGFAHTATASVGDVLEYQIVSTLPSITSAASYLTDYSFIDTAEKGIPYLQNGVTLEFFKDANCTDKVATWTEADGKFNASYTTNDAGYVMSITMTEAGLSEINTSKAVYADASMVNSGYSDCTLRITYSAQLDKSANYGDKGNTNDVVLTWKRTNSSYYDTLVDDCHVYVFGLDLTKKFSDGKGDLSKVEFCLQNDADDYYVVAKYDETAKAYYVTGSTDDKAKTTRFTPRSDGRLLIYGLEDDAYTITELKTDEAYTLLKNGIGLVISVGESSTVCDVYSSDVLGLIQNDPRYADVEEGLFHNMPQKHLEHKLLTASAKVDNKQVTLGSDNGSANAFVPLTVVNTKGFDLPKTGGYGNWMFPAIGLSLVAVAVVVIYFAFRDKKKETNK